MYVTDDQFSDELNNSWKKNCWCIAILPQWFDLVGAITWKVFHVTSSNLLCMLLISRSRTTSIMAERNSKWPINCNFMHFTSIIWPCGRDIWKRFSCILLLLLKVIIMVSSYIAHKQCSVGFTHITPGHWTCSFMHHFNSLFWSIQHLQPFRR